jgi:SNF2 family DNA or RNA helicase
MNKKIEKRVIDMFNNKHFDEDFLDITLDNMINKNILPYQSLHILNLIARLKKGPCVSVLDSSTTGTGKTYCAIATCYHLKLQPIIICPRSIMSNWKSVCKIFNVIPILIVNYETIKSGKQYDTNMKHIKSPYIQKINNNYQWKFNNLNKNNIVVIFDEAHKCKNNKSLNGKLLLSLKGLVKVMLLSATICDKPEDFLVFGQMLDFYDTVKKGKHWIQGIIRDDKNSFNNESSLSKHIYPHCGSKMELSDLGNTIPDNIISVECYSLDTKYINIINEEYKKIKLLSTKPGSQLTEIIKSRQLIEINKVSILIDLCYKYLELNKSVVIFVNFTKTLELLKTEFDTNNIKYSYIVGGQTIEERHNNIELFQKNNNKVMIAMIQAGGESINLHDEYGKSPRVSLINPSMSSIELIQALGRIYRIGTKTKVLQKLVFCEDTYEINICNIIKKKINFLNKLTDDDLIKF